MSKGSGPHKAWTARQANKAEPLFAFYFETKNDGGQ